MREASCTVPPKAARLPPRAALVLRGATAATRSAALVRNRPAIVRQSSEIYRRSTENRPKSTGRCVSGGGWAGRRGAPAGALWRKWAQNGSCDKFRAVRRARGGASEYITPGGENLACSFLLKTARRIVMGADSRPRIGNVRCRAGRDPRARGSEAPQHGITVVNDFSTRKSSKACERPGRLCRSDARIVHNRDSVLGVAGRRAVGRRLPRALADRGTRLRRPPVSGSCAVGCDPDRDTEGRG